MKIQTISVIVVISVLFFINVQNAQAEVVSISGYNSEMFVFVYLENPDNMIKIVTENGKYEFIHSDLKLYKSGSFSLKNPQEGIGLWAHLLEDGKYRITILTSDGVERITASEFEDTPKPVRIEPKSSVGADVSKWNVPTMNSRSEPLESLFGINVDIPKIKYLNDKFHPTIKVFDVRKNKGLKDIPVSLEISRDGLILDTRKGITASGGLLTLKIDNLQYPIYYPKHCYDVKISAIIGNSTTIKTDDILIKYNGNWNPNMDWIDESRWNYLPNSYKFEPRTVLSSDERCN